MYDYGGYKDAKMFNTVKINYHGLHDINTSDNHILLHFNSPIEVFDRVSLGQYDQSLCQVDSNNYDSWYVQYNSHLNSINDSCYSSDRANVHLYNDLIAWTIHI